MRTKIILASFLLISLVLLTACGSAGPRESNPNGGSSAVPSGDIESHFGSDLDYDTVFPQHQVNQITIQITPENWQAMMEDMTEKLGQQGTGGGLKPMQGAGQPPRGEKPGFPGGNAAGEPGPGPDPRFNEGRMPGETDDSNPIWVEAEIIFEEESWQHVGIRFKGNSSLRNTWSSGSLKLPFKLDFDQYEDDYPKTEDQRFFGFKQLSFASNFKDDSLLREKVTADLFREAGVPSAQTAYYAVTLDYGQGPIYLGLYTAVELVDDSVIKTQFSDDSGNVYKPSGTGATFTEGSFSEANFDKETNQEQDDYSDILALYAALHSDLRLTDPAAWRAQLEAIFDVDTFLNWLAVNTVVQNWDTYGVMHHNYYLYNNPETGQLVWIPWDNNESLAQSAGMRSTISIDLANADENWPLISYLRDDPVYYQGYQDYLATFLGEVFLEDALAETFTFYHDLIYPFVIEEDPEKTLVSSLKAFENSADHLIRHVQLRIHTAENFLGMGE